MKAGFENRRRFPRREVNKPAFFRVGKQVFDGMVYNTSVGGMFIKPDAVYTDDGVFDWAGVLAQINVGEVIHVTCNGATSPVYVRWTNPDVGGFGVQYTGCDRASMLSAA
jgi:hypothetical protein